MNTLRRISPDAAIIVAITLAIGLIAQQWAGLDTPDSGFYFSLANFGSEITDRAPVDSYYWTRLGVIAPTYAITQLFGPWVGYFLWRMALLAIIVTAFYITAKKFNASRAQATLLTGTLAASTVILSYLGNPYVTATALAAIAIATCSALFAGKVPAAISGASIGWLAMINPYAALLGGSIWLAVTIQRNLATKSRDRIKELITELITSAISVIVIFTLFLGIGTQLFPSMNWFTTYIEWNSKIDYADFASTAPVWLADPSLLIPVAMMIVIVIQWWRLKTPATQAALTIALTTLGVTISFLPAMAGITLEATIYTSMLWIPLSVALILSLSNQIPIKIWVAVLAVAIVVATGFSQIDLPGPLAIILALTATALLIIAVNTKTAVAAFVLFLVIGQLVQNSRDQIGLYYSSPFAWAYQDNPVKLQLANSLKAQQWLIENTSPQDQILTYVDGDWLNGDRDLYVAASLQFWGENRISVTPDLRPEDLKRISDLKPTVFALYGPDKGRLQQYANELPNSNQLTPLDCLDLDWPTLQEGAMICLTNTGTF